MNDSKVLQNYKNLTSLTYESIKSNVLAVEIFYNDLQYTELSEVEYVTIMGFLSRIGGLFGLFLGMSVLSCIEIFELIIVLYVFIIKGFKNKFFR